MDRSLSLPCGSQTPSALSMVFILLFICLFSPHAQEQRDQLCHTRSSYPVVPPALHGRQLGCPFLLILHKCRSCHAVLASDSPLLWAGVWAGTGTPVLLQIPLPLQLSASACPHPGQGLILSLQSPFSRSAWLCMGFWAGVDLPRWMFSNRCPRTASLKSCC